MLPADHTDRRAKATMWARVIDPAVSYVAASQALERHYATSTERLTPAHLNRLAHRADNGTIEERRRAAAHAGARPCDHGEPLGPTGCALCRRAAMHLA